MIDPQKPIIQINIYLGSLPFIVAWIFRTEIIEILRSIIEQMPF